MISGFATKEDTERFAKRSLANKENYKTIKEFTLSNVGIGTYLGELDSKTDLLVKNAIKESIYGGINVVDTAINYRAQKAERSVQNAISELIEEGKINRSEIFISTKNGYVTNDGDIKEDFWQYVNREYIQRGIIQSGDISSGYHCMTVSYIEDQLNRSLKNLDLECIDLMYLHNPVEGQIKDITKEEFIKNLKTIFEFYESKRLDGKIQFYGLATWECFRVSQDHPQYLSLSEVLHIAHQVAGEKNGFRFIQLPFNMYLDQAMMMKNQKLNENNTTILDVARQNDIGVFTSVPLMQGKLLTPGVMPEFGDLPAPLRCLQFIRSTPGVLAPLVGQKTESHVKENLEIMRIAPMKEDSFSNLLKKLIS